jgi:hypothetical protein
VDEGKVVREENVHDDAEFDILALLEVEKEEEVQEVGEAEAVRERQGKALKCHPAKGPRSMQCEVVAQTVVSESDLAHGDLGVRIDREKGEKGRMWNLSKYRIRTEESRDE